MEAKTTMTIDKEVKKSFDLIKMSFEYGTTNSDVLKALIDSYKNKTQKQEIDKE